MSKRSKLRDPTGKLHHDCLFFDISHRGNEKNRWKLVFDLLTPCKPLKIKVESAPNHTVRQSVKKKKRSEIEFLQEQPLFKISPHTKKNSCPQKVTLIHISDPIITPSLSSSGATVKVTWLSSRWKSVPKMLSKTYRAKVEMSGIGVRKQSPCRTRCKVLTWNLKIANCKDVLFCGHVIWFVSSSTMYDFSLYITVSTMCGVCVCVWADVFHT